MFKYSILIEIELKNRTLCCPLIWQYYAIQNIKLVNCSLCLSMGQHQLSFGGIWLFIAKRFIFSYFRCRQWSISGDQSWLNNVDNMDNYTTRPHNTKCYKRNFSTYLICLGQIKHTPHSWWNWTQRNNVNLRTIW